MIIGMGSGNGDTYTMTYRCPSCNSEGFITLPAKGISFSKK
jgi:hypothetical protein